MDWKLSRELDGGPGPLRTTLIYVGVGVAGFNANRPLGDREGGWIAHGIASIGAQAQAAGFPVELIDLRQLAGWEDLEKKLKRNPADVYGLSVSAVDYLPALRTIAAIKQQNIQAKVIIGGIHPTIFPEQYDFKVIDCVVQGEGEVTFPKLLQMLANGQELPKIVQGEKPDLDAIYWVDRELFDYRRELSCNFAPGQETPSLTMLAGRGCPYRCAYCQPAENAVFGKPHRMRSPENVMGELLFLEDKYHFKSLTFWDDTFTFNAKWINKFCDLYREWGLKAKIAACSRSDIVCGNESMIEKMAGIGVDWLVIGFESGSDRLLDFINKGTSVKQNKEAARICRKHGIKIFGTYMYGLPTETQEESLATARMIDEIAPEHASPFWYVPIPGTDLYKYCQSNGLLLDDSGTIERTGAFRPTIRGIDYGFLTEIMQGARA